MNDIKEQHVCISKSNIKLGMIPSVSLPPIVTCSPNACKFCGKKCYARKMCKLRRSVNESYENNLDILLNDKEKFWREVSGSIALTTYFRFFVSGDIYDKDLGKDSDYNLERGEGKLVKDGGTIYPLPFM